LLARFEGGGGGAERCTAGKLLLLLLLLLLPVGRAVSSGRGTRRAGRLLGERCSSFCQGIKSCTAVFASGTSWCGALSFTSTSMSCSKLDGGA
jgi:hypothetical protein